MHSRPEKGENEVAPHPQLTPKLAPDTGGHPLAVDEDDRGRQVPEFFAIRYVGGPTGIRQRPFRDASHFDFWR